MIIRKSNYSLITVTVSHCCFVCHDYLRLSELIFDHIELPPVPCTTQTKTDAEIQIGVGKLKCLAFYLV